MKYVKFFFFITFSSLIFYSCNNEDDPVPSSESPVAVRFTSTLDASISASTKAAGTSWSSGDQIGIFMKQSSQTLSATTIVDGVDNVAYKTTGNGNFIAANSTQTIYYPTDGSSVDFIAYYPYASTLSGYIYNVDVTDQSNQEAIDLLYSDNSKNQTQNSLSSDLSFTHQLSRISFTITKGAGVSDLSSLKITFEGLETKAEFNLANGALTANSSSVAAFDAKVSSDGTSAEAIIIPSSSLSGRTIKFSLGGSNVFTWNIPSTTTFEKGKKYNYNITLKNSGGSIEPANGWMETPLYQETSTLTYLTHHIDSKVRNFSILYDKTNRVALWVAYPLHSYYLQKNVSRTNKWAYDPSLSEADQPSLFKGWPLSSNYDRGHQIPSSDRLVSLAANEATFYFSNMTMQQSQFNQGTWSNLEVKVQTWAKNASDTLYVVTGVILSTAENPTIQYGNDNSSPARKTAIPQYFYKALAKKVGNTYYTVGYRMPNTKPVTGDVYGNYRVTVSSLEAETGFTFFPNIDQSSKNTVVESQWN